MVLDTTHANKDNEKIVDDIVGRPFSLVQKLKMNGIGSKRMIIDEVSPNMNFMLNAVADLNYGSIEL